MAKTSRTPRALQPTHAGTGSIPLARRRAHGACQAGRGGAPAPGRAQTADAVAATVLTGPGLDVALSRLYIVRTGERPLPGLEAPPLLPGTLFMLILRA